MADEVNAAQGISLASQPASAAQKRLWLALLLASVAVFLGCAPFARIQLPAAFAFIPIYQTALIVNDLITAILLFGQVGLRPSRALTALAAGYLFTASMAAFHMATFPGLFGASGLLGAGPQTTAWLYMFWHGGFPLFVIAYAWLKPGLHAPQPMGRRFWPLTLRWVAGGEVAAGLLMLLATVGQGALPPIMTGNQYTPLMIFVVGSVWVLSLVAGAAVWWRRPHSMLDLSLGVVMVAWLCDVALSAVLNQGRFDLGFYAGRIYGLVAASTVLITLLIENALLYRQQAQRAALAVGEKHHLAQSFHSMLDSLPQPLLILQDAQPRYANQAFAALLGYPSADAVLADLGVLDRVLPPGQRTSLHLSWPSESGDAMGGGEYVFQSRRLDGSSLWLKHQLETVEWSGRPAAVLLPRDITERKLAEDRATQSQLRLVEAVENLPGGFFYLDQNLDLRIWNARLLTVVPELRSVLKTGMPYEEILRAMHPVMDDPGLHAEEWTVGWLRAARAAVGPVEQKLKSGRWFEAINQPTADGGVMCFRTDITQRKLQELELKLSEQRYRTVVENSLQGLMIVQRGKVVFTNRATATMFGYDSPAEMLGMDAINVVHPEDRHQALHVGSAEMRTGDPKLYRYYRGLRKDGSHMRYEAHRSDVQWHGKRAMQWALVDVTQEFALQQQLESSQRMESVGRLAGGIAHDFNNILTVISSHVGFVLDTLPPGSEASDDALVVQAAADRAAALTRQLLAFSRRQILEMRVIDLNEVVTNMQKLVARVVGEDIKLRSMLAPALKPIRADVTQIEQVMMNLIVNARDAMPTGGSIAVETENQMLDEDYSRSHLEVRPGEYVMLAVTDTGIGMDQETQRRIFEPFFTTKPLGKGTGLGLATVYGIVKQMGGSIFVYSEPGKGTTFKIYFPVAMDIGPPASEKSGVQASRKASETILLVEDDELVRRSALRILTGAGYRVLAAQAGEAALKAARDEAGPIHLLLSDVVMPGMSGSDLWSAIRKERNLPVLFMSGYTDDAIVRHGILEGDLPFLTKPFTRQSLLDKVREVLEGHGNPRVVS